MSEFDHSIDLMPALTRRLGKGRTDRIRYHTSIPLQVTGKPRLTHNRIYDMMQDRAPYAEGCFVDDIIQGVVRLDHHNRGGKDIRSIPLNAGRVYNLFQTLEVLSTPEIMRLMDINERHAQKYLRAAKLIMHYVEVTQLKKGAAFPAEDRNAEIFN